MANAVYKGSQIQRGNIHQTAACGNCWADDSDFLLLSNFVTTDEAKVMYIPAGVRLQNLRYRNEDADTGTTLLVNMGFRSAHATPLLADQLTYFGAASNIFQSSQASWKEISFEAITLPEPIWIVIKPTANGTGISGTPKFWFQANGIVIGA